MPAHTSSEIEVARTSPVKVAVVTGSWKPPSRTRTLTDSIARAISSRRSADITIIDLAEVGSKIATLISRDEISPEIEQLFSAVENADLLVVGSPIYKASYTGLFKHFFDLFPPTALSGLPVILSATGGSDRHALALDHQFRPLFSFFNAAPVPTTIYATDRDIDYTELKNDQLAERIERAIDEALIAVNVSPKRKAQAKLSVVSNSTDTNIRRSNVTTSFPQSSDDDIKFAYWVPNVSGGLVISNIEQRTSWDLDYNIKLAQIAEQSGFEYGLSQIRFTAGYGADYQHEPVSFSQALLHNTTKLKLIAALLPGPWNPTLAAKQIASISQYTNGRIAVNIVSGWFRGEFAAIGEHWLDHDERYRRSEEFIRSLRGIWAEDDFTFRGDFYRFNKYSLKPKPLQPLPEIFQGGSSRAARDMAARVSDWYFTNGGSPQDIKTQVDDIRAKAKELGRSVKIGVNAFGIARPTEQEARAVVSEIVAKANPEAVNAFGHEVKNAGKASPEGKGNWANSSFEDLVQYNDGFKTNLIGTPVQIAERIVELKEVGVDLVLLGFLHFQEEVEYFGRHVIPLVRELEARRSRQFQAAE